VRLSASAATDDIVALIFSKYVPSSGYLRSPIVFICRRVGDLLQVAQKAERKWSLINMLTAALLIFLYIFGPKILSGWDIDMEIAVFVVCLVRSIIDYYSCWDFYFPTKG
jgi:hypothetical protein